MSVESSQICITAAESWIWPVVAINKNKRQCGVIVTLFLVLIKGSLLNMSGSLSVRGCTAHPFSTALPTKSSSISGKEDKAVLGKRSGYLFKVRSLRIWESCRTQCRVRSCVCFGCTRRGWGAAFATCSSPAPALQDSLWSAFHFSQDSGGPFLILLTAREMESGEIPFWVSMSFCNFSVLNL